MWKSVLAVTLGLATSADPPGPGPFGSIKLAQSDSGATQHPKFARKKRFFSMLFPESLYLCHSEGGSRDVCERLPEA